MNKKLIKNNNSELHSGKIPNRNTAEGTISPESYNTPISFKVTPSQKASLESEAQKRGTSTSVYARERLFQPPHQDIVIAEGGDILHQHLPLHCQHYLRHHHRYSQQLRQTQQSQGEVSRGDNTH